MKTMKNPIFTLFDATGLSTVLLSIYMNVTAWLHIQEWNKIILFTTSLLGLIFLVMKIYHQYLETKEKRKKMKDERLL